MVLSLLFWKFISRVNASDIMKTKIDKTHKNQNPTARIQEHIEKKKTKIKDLLMRNLMRTNMQLLKTLDLSTIVLF